MELAAHLRYHIHIPACFLPSQWGPAMFSSLPWAPRYRPHALNRSPRPITSRSPRAGLDTDRDPCQPVAWSAASSQLSRSDMLRAQATTACTWSESSAARHRIDQG